MNDDPWSESYEEDECSSRSRSRSRSRSMSPQKNSSRSKGGEEAERDRIAMHRSFQPMITTSESEAADLFQYSISNKITIKKNQSSLVPIIQTGMNCSRVLVYNKENHSEHPISALKIKNATLMTLEEGPLVVYEDGMYLVCLEK